MTTAMQNVKVEIGAVVEDNPFGETTIESWIEFCDVKPCTQATYNKAVKSFLGYLQSRGIAQPSRNDVSNFRKWMLDEENEGANAVYKPSTAKLYLVVVKKFFRWLASNGKYLNVAADVKLPEITTDEHAHDSLTLAEAKKTLSVFKGKSEKILRDKCMMSLMICCGLRSVEVVRLDIGDIERRRGQWFIKIHGKARDGKVDSVQLPDTVKKMIDEYLSIRPAGKKGTPMFISTAIRNRCARLETQSVSRLAKATFAKIGIKSERVTCHSCRATAVTLMLEAGVPMREVQRVVRHKSASTTEIYANDINRYNNRGVKVLSNLLFS